MTAKIAASVPTYLGRAKLCYNCSARNSNFAIFIEFKEPRAIV